MYLVHIPENSAGSTITTGTVVFYEVRFLTATEVDEVTISAQFEGQVSDIVRLTDQQLCIESSEE